MIAGGPQHRDCHLDPLLSAMIAFLNSRRRLPPEPEFTHVTMRYAVSLSLVDFEVGQSFREPQLN